jgi:hypothetical protein
VGLSYGFILQREKVTGTLVSVYMAIVMTMLASPYVSQFFAGDTTVGSIFIKASPTPFIIKTAVFCIVTILLTTRGGLAGMRGKGLLSPLEVGLYSALTTAVVITTILSFLDEGIRANLLHDSRVAGLILQYHDLIIVLPVLVLIVLGFRHHSKGEL